MTAQEIKIQNIRELQKQVALLTAENMQIQTKLEAQNIANFELQEKLKEAETFNDKQDG